MEKNKFELFLFIIFLLLASSVMSYSQSELDKFIYKTESKGRGFLTNFLKTIKQEPFNESYAIIISIGKYDNLSPLESPHEDALKMKKFLLETIEYDEVVILQDSDATFNNIKYFMQTYFTNKMAKRGRYRFLFYFTGHGAQHKGYNNKTIGYLQLKGATGDLGDSDSINMNQIQDWSDQFRNASHVLFLIDSCFSGLAGVETKSYDTKMSVDDISKGNGRYIITAGGADEESIGDLKKWGGSLFTDVLISGVKQGWADSNSDGIITTYELFSYVQAAVKNEAKKTNRAQQPLISNLGSYTDKGQYFFVYKQPNITKEEIVRIINVESKGKKEMATDSHAVDTKKESFEPPSMELR
jgi:hypothetical protein